MPLLPQTLTPTRLQGVASMLLGMLQHHNSISTVLLRQQRYS